MTESPAKIGVLDLQGGVQEHLEHFERVGVDAVPVKRAEELPGLAGLVLPGGESTCLSRLMRIFHIDEAILNEYRRGLRIWGTCAGAILLAADIEGEKPHLGLVDMSLRRNAFGSQLDSFQWSGPVPGITDNAVELTFIRAPKILRVGPDVHVILRIGEYVAAAEQDGILVTVFHPELTPTLAFHRYFATACGWTTTGVCPDVAGPDWNREAWMSRSRIARPASVGGRRQ